MHRFELELHLNTITLKPPREDNRWFMTACKDVGFREECEILNLVQQHQQVVWESDVFGAEGRYLDELYKEKRWSDE